MSIHNLSDKIVFNILKDINFGYLEITNHRGEIFKFGKEDDSLKAYLAIKNPNFTYN